ncbi:MAG: hypothetical protein ACN4GM_13275 [Gammaproteobacteria bacterium]
MTRFTVVNGKPEKPDTVVNVSELDGKMLIGLNKAVLFTPKPRGRKKKDV